MKMTPDQINFLLQLEEQATKEYFGWQRQVLTLSSGSLTILIALQSQFLPEEPQMLFLLQLSWLLFALSVILSLAALAGFHNLLLQTKRDFQKALQNQVGVQVGHTAIPKRYRICGQLAPLVFVSAVVCLTLFGMVNLDHLHKTKPATVNMQDTTHVPQNNK